MTQASECGSQTPAGTCEGSVSVSLTPELWDQRLNSEGSSREATLPGLTSHGTEAAQAPTQWVRSWHSQQFIKLIMWSLDQAIKCHTVSTKNLGKPNVPCWVCVYTGQVHSCSGFGGHSNGQNLHTWYTELHTVYKSPYWRAHLVLTNSMNIFAQASKSWDITAVPQWLIKTSRTRQQGALKNEG